MRILVVSDVHGNLTALEEVLCDAGKFDSVICSGDIVGYGPNPCECLDVLRGLKVRMVSGNHDRAAGRALQVHSDLLELGHKDFLKKLPERLKLNVGSIEMAIFHGSPREPFREYVYQSDAETHVDEFLRMTGTEIIILGHTHIPYVVRSGNGLIVNPGSVGQPRDGDPRASYTLIDMEKGKIEVTNSRVRYDIDLVASRIKMMGLPTSLVSRLYLGL
jgi:putative phosphoesterase